MSKKPHSWRVQTLDELDPPAWSKPAVDSHLLSTCHRLRRKRVCDFSNEDLRIMIGQEIGVPYLLPLALERLEKNPLARGDYYPGDLLGMVLLIKRPFWDHHPEYQARVEAILKVSDLPSELQQAVRAFREISVVPSA